MTDSLDDLVLWTNNACSKSRAAEQILDGRGTRRYYLEDPPTRAELEAVLTKLGTDDATVIARAGVTGTCEEVLDQLAADPSLIERPIAIRGDRAVVARPPERLHELL
ncbi:MAG: ArsC/Spx/MgsR family protein [Mycobacteriales bacterium]